MLETSGAMTNPLSQKGLMMIKVKESGRKINVGQKIERLTVLGWQFKIGKDWRVVVKCDCGNVVAVSTCNLRTNHTTSCGCKWKEWSIRKGSRGNGTHREIRTKLYWLWIGIRSRCESDEPQKRRIYKDRGISVCDEWKDSYEAFRDWAKENGYQPGLQIDRIKNELGYSPENCRFVTPKINSRNRRDNVNITAWGETKTASAWVEDERCKVEHATLCRRVHSGMNPETAITKPSRNKPV